MTLTVFTGGNIVLEAEREGRTHASVAIAFLGDRVAAVGTDAIALAEQADATVIDLAGGNARPRHWRGPRPPSARRA